MADASFDLPRDVDCIVVGGSAGGLEAMLAIAAALPADFALPLLVVLHRAPDGPRLLADVLASRCARPVTEAVDKQPIEAGVVVVAPPDYHLLVEPQRTLALSLDPPVLYSRPAIDPLFESAAAAFAHRLLAVVLSGGSRDGAAGLAAVRRHGGRAWIQAPEDARVSVMPSAALDRAGADEVLSLEALCRRFSGANVP